LHDRRACLRIGHANRRADIAVLHP
jgi:hypothetical protein